MMEAFSNNIANISNDTLFRSVLGGCHIVFSCCDSAENVRDMILSEAWMG
jgi:hypothetical protein